MKSLKAFLNPVMAQSREVIVSDRFVEDGNPVPFVIRPLTQDENEELIKLHQKKDKKGNEYFDKTAYARDMVAAAVVEPDLDSADLQKAYGVLGRSRLLSKMLLIGEYATLTQAVQEISGLDNDIDELIEEAKNE